MASTGGGFNAADFESSSLLDLDFSEDDSAFALSGGDDDEETSKHDGMSRGSVSTGRKRRQRAGSVGSAASSTLYSQATGGGRSSARSGRVSEAIARRTRARNPMHDTDFDQIDMVAYDHLADWDEGGAGGASDAGTVDSKDVSNTDRPPHTHTPHHHHANTGRISCVFALAALPGCPRQGGGCPSGGGGRR